jgi:hypothetical protein
MSAERERWNAARYVVGERAGHYESWFQRANHPMRPLAFWIRYTIFAPPGRPGDAVGELWAVWFDGERQRVVAVREEAPIARCSFSGRGLEVSIDGRRLDARGLTGAAALGAHGIAWDLRYTADAAPLLLLPERLYSGGFPRAKALVGSPLARYDGVLTVDGERVAVDGWVGSQNHNWGSRHTDRYAWGQVAGFDDAPDAFLELSTARVRIGPLLTPRLTVLVLRLDGVEHRLSATPIALGARATYAPFRWRFATRARGVRIQGEIEAPAWSFVALPYRNPPGGTKWCLNSKIARCALTVMRRGRPDRVLRTANRAAFEILGDEAPPRGVQVLGT